MRSRQHADSYVGDRLCLERVGLTIRSSGAPAAGHQARAGGTPYIFTGPGLAPCRWRPLSSNDRPTLLPQSRGRSGRCGQSASGAGGGLAWRRRVYPRASITRPSIVFECRERSERSELIDATPGRSAGGQSVFPTDIRARTGLSGLGIADGAYAGRHDAGHRSATTGPPPRRRVQRVIESLVSVFSAAWYW